MIRNVQVDLVGLGGSRIGSPVSRTPTSVETATRLYTYIEEPMGLLPSFCTALSQEFSDAGLERRDPSHTDRLESRFGQVRVLDTKQLNRNNESSPRNLKPLRRGFDLRGLREKYKDVVWAQHVHLDRVCISEIGPARMYEGDECVGFKYTDLASVPLPGVTWEPRQFESLRLPHRSKTKDAPADFVPDHPETPQPPTEPSARDPEIDPSIHP